MAATLTTLADEAGVTPAIISRFLRGDPTLRISQQRRERILEVRERLGGVKVRRRRRNRQRTQTVLMPICRIFPAEFIQRMVIESPACRGLEAALKPKGYRLHTSFFDPNEQTSFFESIIRTGKACDGLVLLAGIADERLAALLRAYKFPNISWDGESELLPLNSVRPDTAGGFRQAVAHLQELGHRRIGFVGERSSFRYPLLVAATAAAGLRLDDSLHCWLEPPPGLDTSGSRNLRMVADGAMQQWLQGGLRATALICANDEIAMGVIDAMRAAGLRPGHDLSVIGHDNIEVRGTNPVAHPVLTTVDNPTDRIGKRGAELLLNQILHDQTQIVHERLPAPLIVRESTGACPAKSSSTFKSLPRVSPERRSV